MPERLEPKIPKSDCPHARRIEEDASSDAKSCQVCNADEHLRICLTCGAVHCCESHEAHDTDHYEATGHPLIRPHRADYDFLWCYDCEAYLV